MPDGSCDVTAHVAMDTLDADERATQREALRALGLTRRDAAARPRRRPTRCAYLAALERAGAEARLIDPAGFGGFWWAVKRVHAADVP